jgi:signal transduction histidine kinase
MLSTAEQFPPPGPVRTRTPKGIDPAVQQIVDEQAALRRVATLVARGVCHEELFAVVNQELAQLVRADAAALLRFESDETITRVAAWNAAGAPGYVGVREPVNTALRRLRGTACPIRYGPTDVPLTGPFIAEIRRLGIHVSVAVPIQVNGRVWGVSVAASQGEKPFPAGTETRMTGFAELVGMAISNAESRAELAASRARAIAAADESRSRIQRDLHDGAQQRLVNTILTLKLAKAALEQASHPAAEIVSEALESAQHADADLRELVCGIMPAALRHGGLRAAVRVLLRNIALPVNVEVMPDRLPTQVEATAYFVVAEALTNAVKHAGATCAHVRAAVRDGALELEIRDDGLGGADPRQGTGLVGLADRVASIDGSITITSPGGAGTTIAVHLPAELIPITPVATARPGRPCGVR